MGDVSPSRATSADCLFAHNSAHYYINIRTSNVYYLYMYSTIQTIHCYH